MCDGMTDGLWKKPSAAIAVLFEVANFFSLHSRLQFDLLTLHDLTVFSEVKTFPSKS